MKTQYFWSKANNPTGSSCFGLFGKFCPYLLNMIAPENAFFLGEIENRHKSHKLQPVHKGLLYRRYIISAVLYYKGVHHPSGTDNSD